MNQKKWQALVSMRLSKAVGCYPSEQDLAPHQALLTALYNANICAATACNVVIESETRNTAGVGAAGRWGGK